MSFILLITVDPVSGQMIQVPSSETQVVDPTTGQIVDPTTGQIMDPTTGQIVDPATGQLVSQQQQMVLGSDGQQMMVGPDGQYIPASQQVVYLKKVVLVGCIVVLSETNTGIIVS